MIRHAKLNNKLYEEMVKAGYADEAFPVWWYSPAREGTTGETGAEGGTDKEEGEQIEQPRTVGEEEDPYAPTPPPLRKLG